MFIEPELLRHLENDLCIITLNGVNNYCGKPMKERAEITIQLNDVLEPAVMVFPICAEHLEYLEIGIKEFSQASVSAIQKDKL